MYEYVGADHWEKTSLFDLAKWQNGLAFRDIEFSGNGKPIIKIAELKNGITAQTGLTENNYSESFLVMKNDILFSWSGNPDTSIDVFVWSGGEGWLNQHIFKVQPREDVLREYLFFLLKWLRPRFAEVARNKQTTGLGHVTLGDLKKIMVGLPSLKEQREIIALLGPIQKKIDCLAGIQRTQEKIADLIFKDWFIDFGPTRSKMAGRARYLSPDVWSTFPETLNAEGVPVGWQTLPLSNVVEISPSESLKKDVSAPYLGMASLPTVGPAHRVPALRAFSAGTKFRNGDALLARITPCLENGKTAYVWGLGDNEVGWGSTEFIVMRSKPGVPKPFSYLVARHPAFRSHAIKSMSGTSGRQRADTNAIANYQIPLPHEKKLWSALENALTPLFECITRNFRESIELSAMRDLMLPKLMSGELQVKDAEIIVRKTV